MDAGVLSLVARRAYIYISADLLRLAALMGDTVSGGVDLDVVLLTCMELPSDQLMRRLAHGATPLAVYANAGCLVTADVLRSVAQLRRGDRTIWVAVVHHADCAAAASPAMREASSGAGAPVWSTVAVDATASVGRALRDFVNSGVLGRGDRVVGLVCDREARRLSMVATESA